MNFKESKRALRRFHRNRLLKNRKKYWGLDLYDNRVETNISKIVINTPTPCSCFMCGNPRKFLKEKKRSELIWDEKSRQELNFIT